MTNTINRTARQRFSDEYQEANRGEMRRTVVRVLAKSQIDLAGLAGVSVPTVTRWIKNGDVHARSQQRITAALTALYQAKYNPEHGETLPPFFTL